MYKENRESVDHHFLYCEVAGALWDFFFQPIWVVLGYAWTNG